MFVAREKMLRCLKKMLRCLKKMLISKAILDDFIDAFIRHFCDEKRLKLCVMPFVVNC